MFIADEPRRGSQTKLLKYLVPVMEGPLADLQEKQTKDSSTTESNVRYVLSGQPTGWTAMAQAMRDYDEDKVKDTKEDIDTLLTFVRFLYYTLLRG